jgi:hypothetical protein
MALLTSANWPEVRAALDVSLTTRQVPDAVIAYDLYSGRAMRRVIEQVPTAESMTGDSLQRCKNAAIFYTAAYLAPAIPNITRKNIGDVDQSFDIDWEARAATLLAAAAAELAEVLTPSETAPAMPVVFAAASGYRGW